MLVTVCVLAHFHTLYILILNHISGMYRSIVISEDAVTIRDHWMNSFFMVSQYVQVIFDDDPTTQRNDRTEIWLPKPSLIPTSVLHRGKKAVSVVSYPGLLPHINSDCSWEKEKLDSSEKIIFFHWSADQPL